MHLQKIRHSKYPDYEHSLYHIDQLEANLIEITKDKSDKWMCKLYCFYNFWCALFSVRLLYLGCGVETKWWMHIDIVTNSKIIRLHLEQFSERGKKKLIIYSYRMLSRGQWRSIWHFDVSFEKVFFQLFCSFFCSAMVLQRMWFSFKLYLA